VNQEARFQEQLAELTAQLTARDSESNKLRYQMEELQRDVFIKSSGMDRECVNYRVSRIAQSVKWLATAGEKPNMDATGITVSREPLKLKR
jgi:uncharacterized protein YoxC